MIDKILDDAYNLNDKYYDIRNILMEQIRNINITVSTETDLNNLNRRSYLTDQIMFLDMQVSDILNYFIVSLGYILKYKNLVNEMDSPKDKYLISKLIQDEIKDIEELYNSCKVRMETNAHVDNTTVFNLIRSIWDLVQVSYLNIKNIND